MKRALCLGSGEGGALAAFEEHEGWSITRIDYDEKYSAVPHTLIRDITRWADWIDEIGTNFDVVWFSPDCTEFSTAGQRRPPGFEPDTTLLRAGLAIIDFIKPSWFIVENVKGAKRWFKPYLGRPTQTLGPFYFWGRFPHMAVNVRRITARIDHTSKLPDNSPERQGRWVFNDVQYHKWGNENNAKIPFEISEGLLRGIESYVSLESFS